MTMLNTFDTDFPIDRQLEIEAGPVVMINYFTLDVADEEAFLKAWQTDHEFMREPARFHLNPTPSRGRRQSDLPELCGMGNDFAVSSCIHQPGVPRHTQGLPCIDQSLSAPFPEGCSSWRLCGVVMFIVVLGAVLGLIQRLSLEAVGQGHDRAGARALGPHRRPRRARSAAGCAHWSCRASSGWPSRRGTRGRATSGSP